MMAPEIYDRSSNHKNGKWAKEVLAARHDDGMWGNFHTLSIPINGKAITSEQALRRLYFLGYTMEDEVISHAVERMCRCIRGEERIDSYSEKKHDWPLFEKLMLSAWVRLFDPGNTDALEVAYFWGKIVKAAFWEEKYDRRADADAFENLYGRPPKSGFEGGFGMFYHAALLYDVLDEETESRFLEYYLTRPEGIYYIYDKPLNHTPSVFASREASCYLWAIELLAKYKTAGKKLDFVYEWLLSQRGEDGYWDFGAKANDGVYFPLSDSWRKAEARKRDSTERVERILACLH